ncbi:small secreted protein [Streptomyces sp. DSM 44917]|uniref:Small secreted protein n=1 Tax=Streptomyces boetiae TaxID=3075541 RepID=A0ABU2LAP3_9ACTN|nr:small secreted protein [Streptomyces sp. DSM 44917]MDT0308407.1 small secreted protein [Streptomyces sp. DSM 44917]
MKKKLAATLSGCAVVLLTQAACGGGDNSEERDTWARNFCADIRPQVERIQESFTAIAEVSQGSRPAEEVREANAAAYGELSEAYAGLASVVNDAGDPPVDNGQELRENAAGALTELSESFTALREDMEALDTSDQTAFADQLREFAPRLEQLGENGSEALGELQTGDLGESLRRQEGCRNASAAPSPEPDA